MRTGRFGSPILLLVLQACHPAAPSTPAAGDLLSPSPKVRAPERSPLPPGPPQGPETCFNGTDDNDNRLIDEGCEVRQGPVHVVAAWSEADADVDLYVIGPDGQLAQFGEKTSVGLVRSGDCPAVDRSCPLHRYESVHLDGDEVAGGTYAIRLRLESSPNPERLAGEPLSVRLGIRTPSRTRAELVSFFAEGSETTLTVEVADRPTEERPTNASKSSAPSKDGGDPGGSAGSASVGSSGTER